MVHFVFFFSKVAEYLSDPMCRGIFAGDTRLLSLRSCFPPVYQYENQHGSIVKGALFTKEGAYYNELLRGNVLCNY